MCLHSMRIDVYRGEAGHMSGFGLGYSAWVPTLVETSVAFTMPASLLVGQSIIPAREPAR